MDWKQRLKSEIEHNEVAKQNDWESFQKRYNHFKLIKKIKQASFIFVSVIILSTITYFTLFNKNKVINKNPLPNTKLIQTETHTTTYNKTKTHPISKQIKQQSTPNETLQNKISVCNNTPHKIKTTVNADTTAIVTQIPKTSESLPSANFTIDKNQGCAPLRVQFSPIEFSDSIVYLWEFGDGDFSNEKSPTHTYKSAGNYIISLTTKYHHINKLNIKTISNGVKILDKPKANFNFERISTYNIQFNNFSTNFEQCQWFINGNQESTDKNPTFTLNTGINNVILLVENKGCSDSIFKPIEVSEPIIINVPTAFKPDGDGRNDIFKPIFSVVPNSFKMLIFDQWGNVIFSATDPLTGWNGKINNQEPVAGFYTWKIIYNDSNNHPIEKTGQVKLMNY